MVSVQRIMRILREANDYSQEYVANVLNINQKTYSSLESGRTKITLDRIVELAVLYNVKPEYFLKDQLPIINYNRKDVVIERAHDSLDDFTGSKQKDFLFERILKEKEVQISYLCQQLEQVQKEKEDIYELFRDKILKK